MNNKHYGSPVPSDIFVGSGGLPGTGSLVVYSLISSNFLVFFSIYPGKGKSMILFWSANVLHVMGKTIHSENRSEPAGATLSAVVWNEMKYLATGHGLLNQLKQNCGWETRKRRGRKHSNILNSNWCHLLWPNNSISNLLGHLENEIFFFFFFQWWLQTLIFSDVVVSTILCFYLPLARCLKPSATVCLSQCAPACFLSEVRVQPSAYSDKNIK